MCRTERQFATFSALDACNYAVNIFDEGETLSIVTDCGSHGTHVAGIVAACMRNEGGEVATGGMAPFEGVAPGAQIVSCKIGDNRVQVRTFCIVRSLFCVALGHDCWVPEVCLSIYVPLSCLLYTSPSP